MLSKLLGEFPKVIQMLREDHKQVRTLFRQYEKAANGKKPLSAHCILINPSRRNRRKSGVPSLSQSF